MDETIDMDSDSNTALADISKPELGVDAEAGTIFSFVETKFNKSKDNRYGDELRWMMAYRNYRGIYGPEVQFTETEKSTVFVKVTKTKVQAAFGQITEVLLGSGRFPLTIDHTVLPEGVDESVHFDTSVPKVDPATGQQTPAPELPPLDPGETRSVYERLSAGMKSLLEPAKDKLKEGEGTTAQSVTFHPAHIAAKKMEKKIHDQLDEANVSKELRLFAFDMALYGTGIMEGPYAVHKEYPNWSDEGNYEPTFKNIPVSSHVRIWDFYPDPDATSMDDSEYGIRRHKLSRSKVRALKNRPFFRKNAIDVVLELGETYSEQWWETDLDDDNQEAVSDRFEALEFWGFMDTKKVEEFGIKIPKELKDEDQLSVNIWVCNGQVMRLVMNPFKPAYIPYYACPYELNPNSFFGVGIAENMEDSQLLMNGFMRMAVDNAALSGNLVFEVDETNLVPGQDFDIYPGKKFRRQGGAPGQALFGTKFPNVSNENMMLYDKARQLSDESTGLASFAHGQTGVTGVGRTAAGISMLLGAAGGQGRTVIKNVDDYLITPIGKAYFRFNMQFDHDPEIKGDLEVKAQGTQSLASKEVLSQRLMQFLSVVQNPMLAPFARMDYIITKIAETLDLDPTKVVNNLGDAAIQAEIMKSFQATLAPPQPAGGPPAAGGPPGVGDTQGSGDGNIGVGTAPPPGADGFSGNPQEGGPVQ